MKITPLHEYGIHCMVKRHLYVMTASFVYHWKLPGIEVDPAHKHKMTLRKIKYATKTYKP